MKTPQSIIISLGPFSNESREDGYEPSSEDSESEYEDDDESSTDEENNENSSREEEDLDDALIAQIDSLIKKMKNINDMTEISNVYITNIKSIGKKCDPMVLKISKINKSLNKLNDMIGLKKAKQGIYRQLLYFLQDLHEGNIDMLHTVIEGSPGVGKTELGGILCDIYTNLGILKKRKYVIARRSDLIGEYLGQTATKTQRVIDSALGGVLFIDEAYSIGDSSGRDSFAKECVDTLNQNLSENKKKFMCIIAGYKDSLNESFFSLNEGLKRRFNFRITIDSYTPENLRDIFIYKIKDIGWSIKLPIEKNCPKSFFATNSKYFPYFGGDIESFLFCVKISHGLNIFENKEKGKKKIDINDLKNGFEMFVSNKSSSKEKDTDSFQKMYI